jgi:hypothetical protein
MGDRSWLRLVAAAIALAGRVGARDLDNGALNDVRNGENWPAFDRSFDEGHYSLLTEINAARCRDSVSPGPSKLGTVTWADHVDLQTGRPVLAPGAKHERKSIPLWPSFGDYTGLTVCSGDVPADAGRSVLKAWDPLGKRVVWQA